MFVNNPQMAKFRTDSAATIGVSVDYKF